MVFDVAVVHTCALDADMNAGPAAPGTHVSAGCECHAHTSPLQPEHCSCHGRTSEAGAVIRLIVPQVIAVWTLPALSGHPRWAARHLDHPPHLRG
jgi:hypothetical protein